MADRVEQEIRNKDRTWLQAMLQNMARFRDWMKWLVDTYKLGSDVLAATERYVALMKKLLRLRTA